MSFPLESEAGMIFIISGFIALLVALLMSSLTTSTEKYDICSVKTQSEYSSCFFLGTGGAEKDDYYYFYRINKKGGKSIDRVPMQWTTVYDTLSKSEIPHIIIKKRGGSIDSAELYVPKGTVIDTYDISYPE
ncbi:MAG: hypothetical protein MSA76_09375 [Clostridium sp.]|nr:hypothetical protein [Clostridium sp.]